jgi:SUN domain-containing protein 1/2
MRHMHSAPTRSPPKASSDHGANDGNALERFKRIKERDQQLQQQQQPSLHPELWAVRDTSVNVASAFHTEVMNMHNNNNNGNSNNSARASGSRPAPTTTRSTSVEYESQQQAIANRKILAQAAASNGRMATRSTKPLSHAGSSLLQAVPESTAVTGEENSTNTSATNRNKERGKSPFEAALEVGRRMAQPINIILRHRSQEPSDRSIEANGRVQQSKDSSYDYSAEERAYQADKAASASSLLGAKRGGYRRGHMSLDHKAYEPTLSDLDDEDEDDEVDTRSKRGLRRKKKGGSQMGSSLELPVVTYDKRRPRRGNRSGSIRENTYEVDEEEEGSSDDNAEQVSVKNFAIFFASTLIMN